MVLMFAVPYTSIVPDKPDMSPENVPVPLATMTPLLPVMALLMLFVPKSTPGFGPNPTVPPVILPVPEVLRIIPLVMPSV